ncbi:NAD(+) diphosphatase [Allosphingosinicella indica]|uniref:NAD(+) diphosphatase n=1 Tax=Allosphingosinicella indica TaxID=941907 RepID=A0A1X7GF14_9SPHN|nr:NAD(+) diphosphatase [Allosphingosinicella indica]SMF68765.1 NAD+ diphosphatase [Allosphingosinicella indica]
MIGFTGAGIDRADNLRHDPERIAALAADPAALILRLAGVDPVLDPSGRLEWEPLGGHDQHIFLGLSDGTPLFAPMPRIELGRTAWSVFAILDAMAADEAALWGGARSLIEWHNRHGYCGICGSATAPFRAGWGRRCEGCGAEHFPRVDPVVIMLAEHDGRVLVGRGLHYPPRRYSALAGFVEPGESIEEAVARELAEEAGIAVANVRYVASQPWPFPGSLMIACIADSPSDAITLDATELADAMWVDRAEVRAALDRTPDARFQAPPPYAIAHTLLRAWLDSGQPQLAPAAPAA